MATRTRQPTRNTDARPTTAAGTGAPKVPAPNSGPGAPTKTKETTYKVSRSRPSQRPRRPSPRLRPSERRAMAAAQTGAVERAQVRWAVFQAQQALAPVGSTKARYDALRAAWAAGDVSVPRVSRSTFYSLVARGDAAQRRGDAVGLQTFLDRPRSGRPPKDLPAELSELLRQRLLIHASASTQRHVRAVQAKARELGLDVPSRYLVERVIRSFPEHERTAAAHGRQAALLDALPHATVPAEIPHAVWTLDEGQLPIWMRAVTPEGAVVPVQPWAVVIGDNCSGAILAIHLVDPFAPYTPLPDARTRRTRAIERRQGVPVAEDIVGAFLSAALPELAPGPLARLTGFLPSALRMDRHGTHGPLRKIAASLGIAVPALPVKEPWRRGSVERLIGVVQGLCLELPSSATRILPAEVAREHPRSVRRRATESLFRDPAVEMVPTDRLPTIAEVRASLIDVVASYNETAPSRQTPSPYATYWGLLQPQRARPGRDALLGLVSQSARVLREGIKLGAHRYAWENRQGFRAQFNDEFLGVEDPLHRGLWIVDSQGSVTDWPFLEPLAVWAATRRDPAVMAAAMREERRLVAEASAHAQRARREALAQHFGHDAFEEAEAIQRRAQAEARAASNAKRRAKKAAAQGAEAIARGTQPTASQGRGASAGSRTKPAARRPTSDPAPRAAAEPASRARGRAPQTRMPREDLMAPPPTATPLARRAS